MASGNRPGPREGRAEAPEEAWLGGTCTAVVDKPLRGSKRACRAAALWDPAAPVGRGTAPGHGLTGLPLPSPSLGTANPITAHACYHGVEITPPLPLHREPRVRRPQATSTQPGSTRHPDPRTLVWCCPRPGPPGTSDREKEPQRGAQALRRTWAEPSPLLSQRPSCRPGWPP